MGCLKKAEKTGREALHVIEPIAGAVIGDALGGPFGAAAGAGIGEAAAGGNPTQDLIAAGTAGFGSSVDVGQALGLDTSISGSVGNALSSGASDVTNSLGLTENGISDLNPFGGTGTTVGGAPTNASGTAAAAPVTPTTVTPSSGGGFTPAANVGDFGASQVGTQLDTSGLDTSNFGTLSGSASASPSAPSSTNLGSLASNAIGANSSAPTGLQLGQPDTYSGFGTSPGGANIPGATESPSSAFTPTPSTGSALLNKAENVGIQAALPLAGLAYQAIKGPGKPPADSVALAPGGAATAPLLSLENQGATEASTGQLTPTQQANILQYVQGQQNQLIQQLASQGVADPTKDTRYIQGMAQIQQNALALQQQYITAAINEATSAGGAASQNIATVANQQITEDSDFSNALASAFGALGSSIGGGTIQPRPVT